MSVAFSDDFKNLVRSGTDIVSLVSESVALQPVRGGREFVGLCPFHDDHSPSMRVYPDRQSFRCWACNTGGDCFSFVMKYERVEFREALELLAARANVPIPQSYRQQHPREAASKPVQYEVLAWAENEFHRCLLESPLAERARRYVFEERKLSAEVVRDFKLGYHPPDWEWLLNKAQSSRRYTAEQLQGVRLVNQREGGRGYYDYFVDRVMFPIRDSRKRPVAFGGRVLPDSSQQSGGKYFNSPESPLFTKSRFLYGLDLARDAIAKSGTAVVMEGYTDCIMAHQCGSRNVVGTLGTAMTETHVQALKRFARKVILVYDGDAAGRTAAERSLPKFLAHEVDLRILTLPGEMDPAEFLLEAGGDAFTQLLGGAVEAWEHKFRTVTERYGNDSIDSRHRILQEMLDVLSEVSGHHSPVGLSGSWQMRESVILGKLAQRLNLPEGTVRQQLQELRAKKQLSGPRTSGSATAGTVPADVGGPHVSSVETRVPTAAGPPRTGPGSGTLHFPTRPYPQPQPAAPSEPVTFPRNPTPQQSMERELLEIVFLFPQTIQQIQREVSPAEFTHPRLRDLLELCYELAGQGQPPSYERVTARLEDLQLKSLAALIDEHAHHVGVSAELLSHTLGFFRRRREHLAATAATRLPGPPRSDSPTGLDQDALARLRQATEVHQKRQSRNSLT